MRNLVERVTQLVLRWPLLASFIGYCAVTAVLGRDLLAHLSSTIVHDAGDPLLTAALLRWNASVLPLTHAWWQFPIFHPTPDALAFSEHLLGLSVVATPIEWTLRDPLAVANLVTLLTYPLCGLAVLLLVRHLTGSLVAAFLAGLAFAFSPYRAGQLAHVQMLATFWAPVALLALHVYLDSGRRWWLAMYGGAWLLQALANLYSIYFFSALVALWVLWFVIATRRWTALRDITVATIVAAIPLAPVLGMYVAAHARHGFERTAGEAQTFSADLTSLLCAPAESSLWRWLQVGCRPEATLFPGLALLVLVGVAIVSLWREGAAAPSSRVLRLARGLLVTTTALAALAALSVVVFGPWRVDLGLVGASASKVDKPLLIAIGAGIVAMMVSRTVLEAARRRSVAGFYLFAAFVMWLFALGPTVMFMGVERILPGPFQLLFLLPGGGGVRVPARFWLMATLCLAVVAGLAAKELLSRGGRAAGLVAALLSLGLLSDGWGAISAAPAPATYPDPGGLIGQTVLELPVGNLNDFAPQFLAVAGGWRSVNGYSGYEPRFYEAVRQGARFEVDGVFQPFRERGDLFVIVNSDQPRLRALVERQPGAVCVGDRNGILQYRLPRQAVRATAQAIGVPRRIVSVTSSCPGAPAAAAIDGRLDTGWVCGPQAGVEWFQADLGTPADNVAAVRYVLGQSYRDFPRALVIETSLDGQVWDAAWNGDVIAATIEGSLIDPLNAPATIPFSPRQARFIRLRQTGKDAQVNWALPELEILAGG